MTRADGLILNPILAKGSASHGPESPELSLRGNRRKSPLAHVCFNTLCLRFKALLPNALGDQSLKWLSLICTFVWGISSTFSRTGFHYEKS